jgi:hypothetical protein
MDVVVTAWGGPPPASTCIPNSDRPGQKTLTGFRNGPLRPQGVRKERSVGLPSLRFLAHTLSRYEVALTNASAEGLLAT